jgi:tetratricopeptide (TPR) repeat protein
MWELPRARRHHLRALRLWRAGLPAAAQDQAGRAVALFEEYQGFGWSHTGEWINALVTLASFHSELASHAAAERLHGQALALLTSAPHRSTVHSPGLLADVLVRLGNGQRLQGDYANAELTLRRAVDVADTHGPDQTLTVAAHNALGITCKDTGRYTEAASHYATALALSANVSMRADTYHNLAGLAHAQNRFTEAEAPARQALELREQACGPDSTALAADSAVLGAVLAGLTRYDEAETCFRRAIDIWTRRYGPVHYEIAVNLHNLAAVHQHRGDHAQALHDFQKALRIKSGVLGAGHPEVAVILNNLGVLHAEQGRTDDANCCYAAAFPILERALGAQHPNTVRCRDNWRRLPLRRVPSAGTSPPGSARVQH